MGVLFLANFMNLIDVSIINVALPRIQAETGATATQLEWVAATYILALAVGLLPCGRFGDVFGRRRLFLWGLAGFTAASALCGAAPGISGLIAARTLQGIAAAMMVPQVLAIVHVIFPPEEKSRVFGLFGTISSLGVVVGPVIGGALISADPGGLGWRTIFLINLPLGAAALIGALHFIPDLKSENDLRPDWGGTLLFGVAIVLLVLPLTEGRGLGWPWWTFAALAASIPTAIVFVKWEFRQAKRGLPVLMPMGLLTDPVFLTRLGLVTMFVSGIPGLFLILAIYLQSGLGFSPLQSGLAIAPFPIGVLLASFTTEKLGNRHLTLRIAAGAAVLLVGMAVLQRIIQSHGAGLAATDFAPPLVICGFGMGSAIMALFQVTMSGVSAKDAGAGSGAMQAFQQLGAVLGIAIVGQIFFSVLGDDAVPAHVATADSLAAAMTISTWYPIAIYCALAIGLGWSVLRQRKVSQ